jgi:hypothetical protein
VVKVRSITESTRWYAAVGFDVRESDEQTFAEVAIDGLTLRFIAGETPWPGAPAFTGSFFVHVQSVRSVHDAINRRVDVPWGVEARLGSDRAHAARPRRVPRDLHPTRGLSGTVTPPG